MESPKGRLPIWKGNGLGSSITPGIGVAVHKTGSSIVYHDALQALDFGVGKMLTIVDNLTQKMIFCLDRA